MTRTIKNNYLTSHLDDFLDLTCALEDCYRQFTTDLIHSSLLLAMDGEKFMPMTLTLEGKTYAFVFTDDEEGEKAFPGNEVAAMDVNMNLLKDFLKQYRLEGYILNVASQNMYLTRKFFRDLKNIPSEVDNHNNAYSPEELILLKNSINNEELEDYLKNHKDYLELFDVISSNALFALIVSDNNMDILEFGGLVEVWGLSDKYDYYDHNQYIAVFTSEDSLKEVKTSKFKYLSLVDFATVAHYSIKNEFAGIVINPGSDSYLIPIDILIKNWDLINERCFDYNLVTAKHNFFVID